jgi:EmrB/QacA subfamily drug resistance transporter
MVVLDGSIVNVSLPAIQADLNLSVAALGWVVDAYLLALGGCMLLAARAGDLWGRRRVLQAGLAVFTLASLAGGMATSGPWLLLARAVQGLGASALSTSTLTIIMAVFPAGSGRGRAISWWATSTSIASAAGVLLGGWLTTVGTWRWVMWVNVPIGLVLVAAVALCLAPTQKAAKPPSLDVPGAVTITLGVGSLLFGILQSMALGWDSPIVWTALVAGAALLLLFVRIEARARQPLVRLGIFALHNVRMGNIVVMCMGAALTASTYFGSIVLQQIAGYSPLHTGLAILPMGLTVAVAAPLSRRWMDQGVRRLPFWGGLISAAGLLWLGVIPAQPVYAIDVLGPMLLLGLGLGLMLMTSTHTAVDGVPPQDAGLASGLFNTARQLGAALGIAVLSTLAHAVAQRAAHTAPALALLQGYQAAFIGTAALCLFAALASLTLRPRAA